MKKHIDVVFNREGQPLPGIFVRVKSAGTSTDAVLYSDNGTTVKANPVITDSNGGFSFYVADGRYDLTYSGSGLTTRTDSDVVIEDALDKLRELVSVTDFGAVGDGVTSDTAAFALAATASSVVVVPAGMNCYLSSDIENANCTFVLHGSIIGPGKIRGNVVRHGSNVLAVGKNAENLSQGLQIGGGDTSYGSGGVIAAPDGHASWLRFQPSKNQSPVEMVVYPTAAQGRASAAIGTNQVTRVSGTAFSAEWVGKKVYLGNGVYKVSAVANADNLTVTTTAGGVVSFASSFTETFHVAYISGSGVCDVVGATVTRGSGDPFLAFITGQFLFKINGVERAVSAFGDIDTYTLAAAPGDLAGASYTFETDINDQLTTLRLQKLVGADEENLSLYARYDGYWVHALYAGSGKYRPLVIGSGEITAGTLARQLVCQSNGDLTLGGDYDYEAVRVLNQNGAVNRFETAGAAAGFKPAWRGRGADTNVGIGIDTKGTGTVTFTSHEFGNTEFQVFGVGGSSWLAVGSDGFAQPALFANGAATDIDIKLSPKGAGRTWLGPWTSNADIAVNGYVLVKDSSGNVRKLATIA